MLCWLTQSDGQSTTTGSLKEQIDGLDDAATQNNTFGVVEVDNRSQAIAQIVCGFSDNFDGQGVVLFDGFGEEAGANNGLTLLYLQLSFVGQGGFTAMMDFSENSFGDGGTRSIGFQTATIATTTKAATSVNHGMTDLSCCPCQTVIYLAIAHNTSANASPNKDTDKL